MHDEEEIAEPASPVCYLSQFDDFSDSPSCVQIKRAYEPASSKDGARILVDRLWPRGISKKSLALNSWIKEAAPSDALRRWFNHDPKKWEKFQARYRAELEAEPQALQPLYEALRQGPITLVYGARATAHNQAVVLREFLLAHPTPK